MSKLMRELTRVQQELKAPKGQLNKFGGYRYRSCEDILEAVKPLLGSSSITLSDEIVEMGGRVYVRATATFWVDSGDDSKDDEFQSVCAYAREPESKKGADASQITGAASSYARKYALNGLFLIDDTRDADATNDHGKGAPAEPKRDWRAHLDGATSMDDLKKRWSAIPASEQPALKGLKDQKKAIFGIAGGDK